MFSSLLALILGASLVSAGPLAPRQTCADVTVIFARGTGEVRPIGTVVGPPFRDALQSALGSRTLSFIGVDYAATVGGFFEGGDPDGARTMAADVNSAASSCPNTKIVMSGYSQGAQVTHLAAGQLSSTVQNRVNAVVVFGDPDNGQAFPGGLNDREITFCANGDDICDGGVIITSAHLSYGADAPAAAQFVIAHV
ncbi:carbohydrate esterase family 5 protein [Amanita thiersii Skay4041]|uniref:Cutinase n=1 Tax=Amanita thiersii Skay4041 TaxID=703135 RepID=A0A2A9NJJ5_9AGAR|nr:carbohydrate esterase family 5 protein [Amanita thiersii Skay4041]